MMNVKEIADNADVIISGYAVKKIIMKKCIKLGLFGVIKVILLANK